MPDHHDPTRRKLLAALPGLTLVNLPLGQAIASTEARQPNGSILVAYFSRSGNTRVIAGVIQRTLQADLFEIAPASPYPADYFQTVAQAQRERDLGLTPALKQSATMAGYHTLYVGFPIWGMTVPPVVKSFLSGHDLAGKRLVPFITHGGYGIGDSEAVLARLASGARRDAPLIMECDQERRTTETVARWLEAGGS